MKQRIIKTSFLVVMALLLAGILLPLSSALAADGIKTTLDLSHGSIVIGDGTVSGYDEAGAPVETPDEDGYVIKNTTTTNTITVTGGTHNITLSNVLVDVSETINTCAFAIRPGAVVNLSLAGINELTSGTNCAGLQVPDGATVTIDGIGSLTAGGGTYGAGIGGSLAQSGGEITINNAEVTANGGSRAAGIGGGGNTNGASSSSYHDGEAGGNGGSGGSVTINGGEVVANGGAWGAGIGGGGGGVGGSTNYTRPGGGGIGGTGGSVTINGGDVRATGGERGAGIGGGGGGNGGGSYSDSGGHGSAGGTGGTIDINGGDVRATGGERGAGIGGGGGGNGGGSNIYPCGHGGAGGTGGTIDISGGDVTATGGERGAGIGGGGGGNGARSDNYIGGNGGAAGYGGDIAITGGHVTAIGIYSGAGVGSGGYGGSGGTGSGYYSGGSNGSGSSGGNISISDATVNVQGGDYSAVIGGGAGGSGGVIIISNTAINAQSSLHGAGIGGGYNGSSGSIEITSSTIDAQSINGAGIGGGNNGSGESIEITSSTIDALSSNGAGIGGGSSGSGGNITIVSGNIDAQSSNGAGIGGGGGNGGDGGEIWILSGEVTAQSINGAGVGGGAGVGVGGGAGGDGGIITIDSGRLTAISTYGAGIGGGNGGDGSNGSNGSSGTDGGKGGNGGSGGSITINGGIVIVPGESFVIIDGGIGGIGGAGGQRDSGGVGGDGGNGGNGGEVIITGGTILPSGSGTQSGIGGGNAGNGGKGDDGYAGVSWPVRPSGKAGIAPGMQSCVVTGGTVKARIGCTPTTGGDTPVNVYCTLTRVPDFKDKKILSMTLKQEEEIVYDLNGSIYTDAEGWLYLYLPAYEGITEAKIEVAPTLFHSVNGHLKDTATFYGPNFLKMNQLPFDFVSKDSLEFTFGEEVVFTPADLQAAGGTVSNPIVYTYSGTERGTGVLVTGPVETPPVNAGSYRLIATMSGDDYYHNAVATKSFMIHPKNIEGFTMGSVADYVYSGTAKTPAVTVGHGGTTLVSGTDYSVSYTDNTNAGTARVSVSGENNYIGTLSKTFQITPKDITLTLSAETDEAMAGSDVALTATVNGAVDLPAGTLDFKYKDTLIAENVPISENDGSYSATVTWSSVPAGKYDLTATYNAAVGDNYACILNGLISDFNILKYNQTDFAFTDGTGYAIVDGVINTTYEETFTLKTKGKLSSADSVFAVTSGSDVLKVDEKTGEVTLLKSGTAIISVLSPTDPIYNEATVSVSIVVAKAEQTGFGFGQSNIAKTYGDASFTVAATGGQSTGGVTYAVTQGNGAASVDADSGLVTINKSGTVVITAARAGDERYLASFANITIAIERAEQSGFGFAESRVAKTYGDASFAVAATGGQSTGGLTYAVTSGKNVVSVNEVSGSVSIRNAGSAVITATRAQDDMYNAATHTITIAVDKAETSVASLPKAANIKVIGVLSTSTLSGGTGSVPGQFGWANPDQLVSKNGKYQAVFTPEDTRNYLPSTCEVDVNIVPVLLDEPTGIEFDLSQASLPEGITTVKMSLAQMGTEEDGFILADIADRMNAAEKFSGSVLAVYDLALLDQNGQPITGFTGAITVRIPVPDGMSGDLRVFWFDTQTNKMVDMNARLEDGWLVFETTHFSYYAIVQAEELSPETAIPVTGVDAGGNTLLIILLILAGAAVAAGLVAYIIVRNKRKA